MHVLVSGSTGLIGSALVRSFSGDKDRVTRLVRGAPTDDTTVSWDPKAVRLDTSRWPAVDAVVHLAGENVAGRWTRRKKRRIRDSRVNGTRTLCEALARMPKPPPRLISASAMGFYGDRGDEVLTEDSPAGTGFLSDVCREWEAATSPASDAGIRVVNLRIGVVLSTAGGALAKMLTPFRMGIGGRIGSGRQYISWIALDDVLGAIHHVLTHDVPAGPVNVTAPNPVTNAEFTKALGRVVGRPTLLALPAFAARVALGQMANEMLLASTRVVPRRLSETRYAFRYEHLEAALRHLLG
ncbi:MAG: TIGR01777 family oxidoreductase [Phycisphaerales bacterium]|nr:MAG: TIGR01777 family oxidoreductase [Phycisphaerales bacterium]